MEDRRNVGESSCNSGDGTDQRVQSLMFMMMMMMMMMMYMRPIYFTLLCVFVCCAVTVVVPFVLESAHSETRTELI